jgi:hypothetical protein
MKKRMLVEDLSRMGGNAVVAKHGVKHMKKIAKRSRRAVEKKYGADFYKELSRKGVEARRIKREKSQVKKGISGQAERIANLLTGSPS